MTGEGAGPVLSHAGGCTCCGEDEHCGSGRALPRPPARWGCRRSVLGGCPAETGPHRGVPVLLGPGSARPARPGGAVGGPGTRAGRSLAGCGTGAQPCACPGTLSPAVPPALGRAVAVSPAAALGGHQTPSKGPAAFGLRVAWSCGLPAAACPCSLPEEKGIDLGQRSGAYFYSCCHH